MTTSPQVAQPIADPEPHRSGHSSDATPVTLSRSFAPSRKATPEEREAILAHLHEQLHELNQERRAGTLTKLGQASLRDVKDEIDRWELDERRSLGKPEVVSRLEALTERVLRVAGSGAKL